MNKKLCISMLLFVFFGTFNTDKIEALDNSGLEILAIVTKTSNMGIIIIGMIVVVLGLVGYTLISNRK